MSQSVEYMVRDGQGQEYGPADIPTLRQWVMERRILAGMQIAPAGTQQWTVAGLHPQLADLFRGGGPATGGVAGPGQGVAMPGGYPTIGQAYGPGTIAPRYPVRQTNSLAVASLICALLGIFGVCAPVSLLGVIFGHVARGQMRRAPGQFSGEGIALAGLTIGYICTAMWVGILLLIVVAAVAAPGHR